MSGSLKPKGNIPDVCLILEGTYPYVQGGVSSWVHQLIQGLPDVTFCYFFMGSVQSSAAKRRYDVPKNVVAHEEMFLFERQPSSELYAGNLSAKEKKSFYERVAAFYFSASDDESIACFWHLIDELDVIEAKGKRITFYDLCRDEDSWRILIGAYQKNMPELSFLDFFWSIRSLHMPLWHLLLNRHRVPQAKCYHSVSTGYAGAMGALAARRFKAPYLVNEHGIYTKERLIELNNAEWIFEPEKRYFDYSTEWRKLNETWVSLFKFLGRLSYDRADLIASIIQGNVPIQIEFGAVPEKIEVIPNGIHPEQFDDVLESRMARLAVEQPKVVGFIGRVVSIKDVKTLLRAAKLVNQKVSDMTLRIIGPYEEEKEYYEECVQMINEMGLQRVVQFTGSMKVHDALPGIDVMVLTSISEGLPLVILEAYAAGIPVVSTDVGACRELIFGVLPEDKALGKSGMLTPIASPSDTADALILLLQNKGMLLRMGEVGRKRVERFYMQKEILHKYDTLYRGLGVRAHSEDAADFGVELDGDATPKPAKPVPRE